VNECNSVNELSTIVDMKNVSEYEYWKNDRVMMLQLDFFKLQTSN
jgi:hypothetical protein